MTIVDHRTWSAIKGKVDSDVGHVKLLDGCFQASLRMKYLCRVLLWSLFGTTLQWAFALNAENFVDAILSDYRTADQAGRADTSRDGLIAGQEFSYSLYQNADFEGNNDNGVTMNELVDYYVKHYNVSSELAIFMFDLLNDPGNKDNVITAQDITLRSFLGRDYASVAEYRDSLHKWITQAAKRLYHVLTSHHVIDRSNDLSPRYDIISNIDADGDDLISLQELRKEFQKFSPNRDSLRVSRNSWIERNVHTYGADPVTSILTFDYWDRDGDLAITLDDLNTAALELDRDGDGRISKQEFLQYFERGYTLSRRMSGKPIRLPMRACPVPWWSKVSVSPSMDAVRAAMDFDDDFDGWISADNVRRWLMLFDTNGDGFLSRNEYVSQHSTRYGVNSSVASSMFDLVDSTGDGLVGEDDWRGHFKDGIEVRFCDARRSILDLARMAETFSELPQAAMKRNAMKKHLKEEWNWFLQNNQDIGWMAFRPFINPDYHQNRLCQGQVACYEGEQTKAWGLPGASLWWVQGIYSGWSANNMDNMAQIPGGPLMGRVIPAVLMGGPPLKRATSSPSQSKGPDQNPRQTSGSGLSQPNSNNFQFNGGFARQYPNTNNKGQMTNPLMKQYQRLFNQQSSFGPQDSLGVTNQMRNFDSSQPTGAGVNFPFRSPSFSEKQNQNFAPNQNVQSGFRTGNQDTNVKPTVQPWSASQNPNFQATPRSLTNFPGQNLLPQRPHFPFIGYPLLLSVDPSSSLLWRTMTRRRKALSKTVGGKAVHVKVRNVDETQEINKRQKRDEDASMKENRKENVNEKDTDHNLSDNDDINWDPVWPAFRPSPFDVWMAWTLERLFLENAHEDLNTTGDLNETVGELSNLEQLWDEMEMSREDDWLKGREQEGDSLLQDKTSDSRHKRNLNSDESDTGNDDRHKRWILYVQRLKRNPYLYNMWNMRPNYYCLSPFHKFDWRDKSGSPYFPSPCFMYYTFPWWRRTNFMYRPSMWSRNMMGKRNRRDTSDSDSDDTNTKRAFSFDNWFKNKQDKSKPFKQDGDGYMSQIPSSTNTWKASQSSKYGVKNNWGHSLEEESNRWDSSNKETYGYSNGKWKNNQRLNDRYQHGHVTPTFSPMGRMPSFSGPYNQRQWDTGRFMTPQNDMYLMHPYLEGPSSSAGFLMPSLVAMTWNKRNPQGGYKHKGGNKFKHPNLQNRLHQGNWGQDFSAFRDQWMSMMSDSPWRSTNHMSNFYDMFNQGPQMWSRRFIRKSNKKESNPSGDEKMTNTGNIADTRNKRHASSTNKAKIKTISDLKDIFQKLKIKNKLAGRISSWMPWESWKRLRTKSTMNKSNKNSVVSFQKVPKQKASLVSDIRQKRSVISKHKRWGYSNPIWKRHGWTWNRMHPGYGQSNWNGMWNGWNPGYNWDRWSYMRHPRTTTNNGESAEASNERPKRDTENADRNKRWHFANPMWFGNGWNGGMHNQWNPWYNNYMRFARDSEDVAFGNPEDEREKRDAGDESPRPKRFGMWNQMHPGYGQGNWNGMWNGWNPWYSWDGWSYMRYPRTTTNHGESAEASNERPKRDAENVDRNKRWNYNNPMWFGNGWNGGMYNQWNPWYNNYMRFARDSEDVAVDNELMEKEKRDAGDEVIRPKRFGMWNQMHPGYGQGNWNGMWNGWNPWYNWDRWSYMRYPRESANSEAADIQEDRVKRSVEETERTKRWNYHNPMWFGNLWSGGIYNQWNPWYNWHRWSYMRYPRESANSEAVDTQEDRVKRSVEETERTKRWNYKNPMWFENGWNGGMHNQWNPWYNNYMRFARDSQDVADGNTEYEREKRDAGDESPRPKRYGMWNQMHPGYGQGIWNGMWNGWNPWYNWHRWSYMRYPRDSNVNDKESGHSEDRNKRYVKERERSKRWYHSNPMWSGNGWHWNQGMYNRWNPWYNQVMRFNREAERMDDDITDVKREKRDAKDGKKSLRPKRFGMWNQMHPGYRQGNWNEMWNGWNPWYNWYRWSYMRYPRDSANSEATDTQEDRDKRSVEETERTKRWNYNNPMWFGNGWNGGMHNQWNPWYKNYMRFARDSEDVADGNQEIGREKRDAGDEGKRPKRYGMWNQMHPRYGQGIWNGMWNGWNPWYNRYRWSYMRYPRTTTNNGKSPEASNERPKRDAENVDRNKRWHFANPMWFGNGWNGGMYNQWNPWYNNYMRFARDSEDVADDKELMGKEKRDAGDEVIRPKRFGMWNQMHPGYGQGNWNGMWNGWNSWYNWDRLSYMRHPRESANSEATDTQEDRVKRSVEETERTKRWNYNNPMSFGNGWNRGMYNQWNPWFNNYMRFARDSDVDVTDDVDVVGRDKRDAYDESQRLKRFEMWNQMHPGYRQGDWNGMWNGWNPWYNWYRWSYMRYPRDSKVNGEESEISEDRNKRDAKEKERSKRWYHNNPMWSGNGWHWNKGMYNGWNPWYNQVMRFNRKAESMDGDITDVKREKRDAKDGNESLRPKRFGMWNQMHPGYRQGNWNGMWNGWNPWYNWYRWSYKRYPRTTTNNGESAEASNERPKREAENVDRNKRWHFGSPMWFGNGWNGGMYNQWNPWYNNYMRFARESDVDDTDDVDEVERDERDAEDKSPRPKRFGMWNQMHPGYGQGNWNGMWNGWNPWYNWHRWSYMRYPRDSANSEATDTQEDRVKRSVEETDRNKRWNYNNPMSFGNGWNRGMYNKWNPWYSNYMRFARDSDVDVTDDVDVVGRDKRDADDESQRLKRFEMWNQMHPGYRQGDWNGMWNGWNPWYNWYRWSYMRYPRDSKVNSEESEVSEDRNKRDVEEKERSKRWYHNNPMWSGNGWPWNQGMYNGWNPWYNQVMRFNREAESMDGDITDAKREIRDAKDGNDIFRPKRFGMWNQMHPGYRQGNWNGMWNGWNPWYNWYKWSYMRYPRTTTNNGESAEASNERPKRDAENVDRNKRWNYNNPMWFGNGWNGGMYNQWNPWYNNYMRFARDSKYVIDRTSREKRDADEDSPRPKRFGMWNQMHPGYGQGKWNGMWNGWNPGYNWYRWSYMRNPRTTTNHGTSSEASNERPKRDTENVDRNKRWHFGSPMWFGNGWNGGMYNQWNPWYSNYMRFARESDVDVTDDVDVVEREKRDAEDKNPRPKRFGMWNQMHPGYGQGNWNGMWNGWNPWYNWHRWSYMRYPRDSANSEATDTQEDRVKRSVEETERTKHWNYNNPMWFGNGWNGGMYNQWNPWYSNYMRYARDSDVDGTDGVDVVGRDKRDADDESQRLKRFEMWNQMHPGYRHGDWNGMWNGWNPWYNWHRLSYMRYPRDSKVNSEESEISEDRNKRDAKEKERSKRWYHNNPMWSGNGWPWNQEMYNGWNPWYNQVMRFNRKAESMDGDITDVKREKRDAKDGNESLRPKRFGMWNQMHPGYRQGNWNGMWNGWNPWYNRHRWSYMRHPRDSANNEATETQEDRVKRSVEETKRNKRWPFNNPMRFGNGWSGGMYNQWNPWYNNYMRFARESDVDVTDDVDEVGRDKRDAEDKSPRPKRYGMWNQMHPGYGQGNWNGMWNGWNPWYNWHRWSYMRYPRAMKDETINGQRERRKRDSENAERSKRWNVYDPMWSGNGWNHWNYNNWNPWYNNYMRFARDSQDGDTSVGIHERSRRGASHANGNIDSNESMDAEKRFADLKKEDDLPNLKVGSNDRSMMNQLTRNLQNKHAVRGNVMDESNKNHVNTNHWTRKLPFWMRHGGMDTAKRSNNYPWFWPRYPWMWYGQQRGFPMMFTTYPWRYY